MNVCILLCMVTFLVMVNIPGNERADTAAEAALGLPVTNMKQPACELVFRISKFCLEEWQDAEFKELLRRIYRIFPLLFTTDDEIKTATVYAESYCRRCYYYCDDHVCMTEVGWRAKLSPTDHPVSEYVFDVCVSADGKRNTLQGTAVVAVDYCVSCVPMMNCIIRQR